MIASRTAIAVAGLSLLGICFWLLVCAVADVREPWDATHYWTLAYPSSILLTGRAGSVLGKRAWLAGVVLTLAQLPVMLAFTGVSAMSFFALVLLCLLAIPGVIVSSLGGWPGTRRRMASR